MTAIDRGPYNTTRQIEEAKTLLFPTPTAKRLLNALHDKPVYPAAIVRKRRQFGYCIVRQGEIDDYLKPENQHLFVGCCNATTTQLDIDGMLP